MKRLFLFVFAACLLFSFLSVQAQFRVDYGQDASISVSADERPVVHAAAKMLQDDFKKVLGGCLSYDGSSPHIYVATAGVRGFPEEVAADADSLCLHPQAFLLCVVADTLVVMGSDAHGTAYGLMQISRLLGVSPWEWWTDAMPRPLKRFALSRDFRQSEHPSVLYRGIFINDEDWGLRPWAARYEPSDVKGQIGPRTNERIFQLMLRLRTNLYWPAMHEGTEPFFLTSGNREMAARYGIFVGGSHCEPMASSTAVEWGLRGTGDYDYVHNAPAVRSFWQQRLDEVKNQEIIYTLGMRGVHDGAMQGARTVDEQRAVLSQAIADQRCMLASTVDSNLLRIPQVFIPYKEVLDVYNSGLQVPTDVTLMWCDDNYGYIRHFPTQQELSRPGGNGLYYHLSYWGRPHDYLWLGTIHPALVRHQLLTAYDRGIRRMWVLNVGDIKPAEYQLELAMDMAWNIDAFRSDEATKAHLKSFLCREFGQKMGNRLAPVMLEHYRLAHIRKPEVMGGTRVEEADRKRWSTIADLPWDASYIRRRLNDYASIATLVERLAQSLPADRLDTYFQLVQYPVQGAALHNRKLLLGQLARHGLATWAQSDEAYDSLQVLTREYNEGITNEGKWKGIMDSHPRRLPVFGRVPHTTATTVMPKSGSAIMLWNGAEATGVVKPLPYLGYENGAAELPAGKDVSFSFRAAPCDAVVEVSVLPTHPLQGSSMPVSIVLDGRELGVLDFATQGRSEQWKQNVLTNQATLCLPCIIGSAPRHSLVLRAQASGIVLDQVKLRAK